MRSMCAMTVSDLVSKRDPLPVLKTQRGVSYVHEPKVAGKNTPYWWEEAPVMPLPRQPGAGA